MTIYKGGFESFRFRDDVHGYGFPYPLRGLRLLLHKCDWCGAGGSCGWTDGDMRFGWRWWGKVMRRGGGKERRHDAAADGPKSCE